MKSLKLVAATFAALALVVGTAHADKRSDAVEQRDAAQSKMETLKHELEGLSTDLAQVYLDMQEVETQIPVAQADLDAAKESAAAAEREHQQVESELKTAKTEYEDLSKALGEAQDSQSGLQTSIGAMARDLYKGNDTSALTLLLTNEGPGDLTERAASAETVARAQTRALENAREDAATLKNQAAKQEAMTKRIAGLEKEAKAALEEANAAEVTVGEKLLDLETLQASLGGKKSAWESRKGEAIAELESQEKTIKKADEIIAKVDAENRRKAEEAAKKAAEEAKKKAPAPEPNGSGSNNPAPAAPVPEPAANPAPSGGGTFAWPVPKGTPITSPYGMRLHPILGIWRLHDGTDFGIPCGSPQYATADGVVAGSFFDGGGGNMLIINHGMINGSSWTSQHLHMQQLGLPTGTPVKQGQVVGYTGTTGNSTGCHLHFIMQQNGSTVNPMDYLS